MNAAKSQMPFDQTRSQKILQRAAGDELHWSQMHDEAAQKNMLILKRLDFSCVEHVL